MMLLGTAVEERKPQDLELLGVTKISCDSIWKAPRVELACSSCSVSDRLFIFKCTTAAAEERCQPGIVCRGPGVKGEPTSTPEA